QGSQRIGQCCICGKQNRGQQFFLVVRRQLQKLATAQHGAQHVRRCQPFANLCDRIFSSQSLSVDQNFTRHSSGVLSGADRESFQVQLNAEFPGSLANQILSSSASFVCRLTAASQ